MGDVVSVVRSWCSHPPDSPPLDTPRSSCLDEEWGTRGERVEKHEPVTGDKRRVTSTRVLSPPGTAYVFDTFVMVSWDRRDTHSFR
jgi:hypothetical protein